jgi:WD40 repeat protein
MYLCVVDEGRKLVTSDVNGLKLYELGEGDPEQIAEVDQPGELPFFEQSASGERLTHANGVVARSFTPVGLGAHWTEAPSNIGLYSASDLKTLLVFDAKQRLDHESLALSPDARILGSVLRGAGAVAFDARTGAELWRVPGEIASGTSWSSDGRYLALGETGQGGGTLTLIDVAASPVKQSLRPPSSKTGLYDSPFASAFSRDGRVAFTSSSWGQGGVSVYDAATQKEIWSLGISVIGEEDAEQWPAIELAFALDDALILAVQNGLVQAFRSKDGTPLGSIEFETADAQYFAVDSARRRLWIGRDGAPAHLSFRDDWK